MKHFKLTLIWGLLIAIALFTPGDSIPESGLINIPHFDKVVHATLFLVLEWLVLLELHWRPGQRTTGKQIIRVSLVVTVFAISTELLQMISWVGRDGSVFDLLADLTGILLALAGIRPLKKFTDRFYPRKIATHSPD